MNLFKPRLVFLLTLSISMYGYAITVPLTIENHLSKPLREGTYHCHSITGRLAACEDVGMNILSEGFKPIIPPKATETMLLVNLNVSSVDGCVDLKYDAIKNNKSGFVKMIWCPVHYPTQESLTASSNIKGLTIKPGKKQTFLIQ